MALNVTIDGYCYLENSSISSSNVRYQMLFYPNGTASSSTTWNDVRVVEASGYYSANLGDLTWLGQDGIALSNSKIVVVFWMGDTTDRNSLCNLLIQWGAFEITVDGSNTYTNNTQVKGNIQPTLVWSLADTGLVDTDYATTNGSYDVHNWIYDTTTMYHWRTRYGEDIQLINTIDNTDYYWGDTSSDLDLPGAATETHQWSTAGSYDVNIVIEDECGATVTGTENILIYNHTPIPNITCNQAVGQNITTPDTVVTFIYSGTDTDNAITSIDWTINDDTNTVNTGAGRDDTISHTNGTGTEWCGHTASAGAFTDSGVHTVAISVNWFDGFNNQIVTYDEDFTQQLFGGPTVDFSQDPLKTTISGATTFTNTSTDITRVGTGLPDCESYDWYLYEDSVLVESQLDVSYGTDFVVNPMSIDASVKLCAHWNDGWTNYETCEEKDIIYETIVTVTSEECYYNLNVIGTSGDGTISAYQWKVYSDTVSGTGVGPWTEIWQSPADMDQNDKKVAFTSVGYFKVEGFVLGIGATTSDDEIIYVSDVCEGNVNCVVIVWNGTGVDDTGGDWTHSGHSSEESYAKYSGTNGLDANLQTNYKVQFHKSVEENIVDYDLLTMYLKVLSWDTDERIKLEFYRNGGTVYYVYLDDYANIETINEWQKVFIPLNDFGFVPEDAPGNPIYTDRLILTSTGNIHMYMDNIELAVGQVVYRTLTVGTPVIETDSFGQLHVEGTLSTIGVRGSDTSNTPSVDPTVAGVPQVDGDVIGPPKVSAG